MQATKHKPQEAARANLSTERYSSVLLSQTLVAFTIEFDSEFERRMLHSGYPGSRLSLVVWSNLLRFLTAGDVCVRDLSVKALTAENDLKFELGCLERWGFIVLRPDPAAKHPFPKACIR